MFVIAWCRSPDSNRDGPYGPWDFKSNHGGVAQVIDDLSNSCICIDCGDFTG